MCPACMGSLLLAIGGVTSAGGVAAIALHKIFKRKPAITKHLENENRKYKEKAA